MKLRGESPLPEIIKIIKVAFTLLVVALLIFNLGQNHKNYKIKEFFKQNINMAIDLIDSNRNRLNKIDTKLRSSN